MQLVLDEIELKLLLERKRDFIGHKYAGGLDIFFSGSSFFLSSLAAEYRNVLGISGPIVKLVCLSLGIAFALRGVYMMIQGESKKKHIHKRRFNEGYFEYE